jgi:phosphoglycerate dehydrogenase-like enzyme
LFNAPLALNHATASTALLFMLALAKRLPQQERLVRLGRWDLQTAEHGHEIEGRTLGIVGLGHSGRELVRLVSPFSMRILAYSPHADAEQAAALGVRLTTLDEVFREADFVSVHSHLTPEKHHMIRAEHLRLMKPTAYFVNVARGELVDQAALVEVLRDKHIAGAALDVFEHEPLPSDDPLTKLDNVILTPHWNCSTTDVWRATGQAMALGMLYASRGEVPENVVNKEVLEQTGFREKLARFEENRTV